VRTFRFSTRSIRCHVYRSEFLLVISTEQHTRKARAKKHKILCQVLLTEHVSAVKPSRIYYGPLLLREKAPRDEFLELLDAESHLFFTRTKVHVTASFAFGDSLGHLEIRFDLLLITLHGNMIKR